LIDLADEIAYLTADLDDGVESGLLEIGHIREHVSILNRSYAAVEKAHPGAEERYIFHDALQAMQKTLAVDLIESIAARVAESGAETLEDIRNLPERIAVFSAQAEAERLEEKKYLYDTLYTCEALEQEHRKAEEVVTELFEFWMAYPEELPGSYLPDIESEGLPRTIADYIAGMTDNFILMQFASVRRFVRSGRLF
jgi:dGTPase